MATVYAVASAKGGVGKTTTTAAMAAILADAGADVVAIDADIGMANLAGALGVTPGETTLHDVLAERAEPLDAVHEGPDGLRVVPGAEDLDAYASADPAGLADVVAAFEDADYVFIDAGAGLSHDSSLPLAIADETLLVSTAERSALGDTEKTRQLAERLGGTVAGAAVTRADPAADLDTIGGGTDDIGDVLDATVLGRIPEDDAVVRATTATRSLPEFAPDAPATRAYRDLVRTLTGEAVEGAGLDVGAGAAGDAVDDEDAQVDEEADNGEGDEEEPDEAEDAAEDDDASAEGDDTNVGDEEEIIVADAEAGGLSEPGDEADIIVADESDADRDGEAAETDDEASTADSAVSGETRTVGEDRVDGDDLEAMIEESVDEAEAFEEPEAGGTDEREAEDDGGDGPTETGDSDGEADDATDEQDAPDDELAGSVPFRDDDTGTMDTVLSEESDDADGTDEDAPADPDETDDEDESSGGFFSRLFGR